MLVMLVNTSSIAGRKHVGGIGGVGAEYLDWFDNGEPQNLEATSLEFCDLGICAGVNDNIGHDVVCLEIIERDDHPAGRCGGSGGDGGERGDGGIARVHRDIGSI